MTSSNRDQELRRFYQALPLEEPLEVGDKRYVADLHHDGGGDPIAQLATQIDWDEGSGVYLFTGQRGTGKSTELRRLQHMLREQGNTVLLVDMAEYLHETQPVEISDFLISVLGAMSDRFGHELGNDPAVRSYWERVGDFLAKEVKVEELNLEVGAASLKLGLRDDPTFKQRIRQGARGHVSKLVKQGREFVSELVDAVHKRPGYEHAKVVLIVDSVERLRGVGAEGAKQVYDSVVNLFSGHADNLKFPQLHVVYSIPPYLSALTGALSAYYGGKLYALASVHVFENPEAGPARSASERGVAAMIKVIETRYAQWGEVFTDEDLRRLVLISGGDLRDYFRMIRNCLTVARQESKLPLVPERIDAVLAAARREIGLIPNEDMVWLRRIAATHKHELESIEQLSTLARFFDGKLVLNYRNGADWYDVHPLLWDVIAPPEQR